MREGIPMVTATEYRELALKFYRWAAEAETEEVRETYLRLAREWTLAALGANDLTASTDSREPFTRALRGRYGGNNLPSELFPRNGAG